MSYEAGYLFENKLAPLASLGRETPLMAFGIFDGHPRIIPCRRRASAQRTNRSSRVPGADWSFEAYKERFDKLHWHIRQGDCYQANLTMPIRAEWTGDPIAAFWSLIERQPVHYGALVNLGGPVVLSRSPELFFNIDRDGWIETHPMKGTAQRGATPEEDRAIIEAMKADEKTQAENRMIVDLLRNDISRITEVGTLDVPRLFDIETYPTVHQMVSHVRAKLLPNLTVTRHLRRALPLWLGDRRAEDVGDEDPARIWKTARAMPIAARSAYIAPDGRMRFNVAIRTISLFDSGRGRVQCRRRHRLRFPRRGRICRMSMEGPFRNRRRGDRTVNAFSLIETMRFEPSQGIIRLTPAHGTAGKLRPQARLSRL
jgi:para-aminobenzoate synthetase component 1